MSNKEEASQELRETNSGLLAMMEHLQAGVLVSTEAGRVWRANLSFCHLFSLVRDPEDLRGKGFQEVMEQAFATVKDPRKAYELLERAAAEGKATKGELLPLRSGQILEREYAPIPVLGSAPGHLWIYRDVSQRQAGEKRVEEARAFLQKVVDASPSMIVVMDKEGKALFVNRETAEFYGAQLSQLISKSATDVHPVAEEATRFESDCRKVILNGERVERESEVTAPDGSSHWFNTIVLPITQDNGELAALAVATDITKRRTAEVALEENRYLLGSILDHFPGFALALDLNGRVLFANRNLVRLGSPPPEECVGHTLFEIFPEDFARMVHDRHLETRRTRHVVQYDDTIVHSDGTSGTYWTTRFPLLRAGKIFGTCAISTDITDLREAERRVAASDEALGQVLDAFQGVLYLARPGRGFLLLRGGVSELTGWSAAELLSGHITWRRVVHPEDRELVDIENHNMLTIPGYVSNSTYRIVRRNGETRWVQDIAQAAQSVEDGELVWQGSLLDITQRKQSEIAQAHWEVQRSRFIANVIDVQEQERARIRRELHDGIGQILAGLQVQISALRPRTDPKLSSAFANLRNACMQASDELRRLLHGLGPMALDDLGLGAALVRLIEEESTLYELEIDLQLDPELPWDHLEGAVGIAVYRIVQEAISNVAKHARTSHASVVLDWRPRTLRLMIEDAGVGFDTFHRSVDPEDSGLGLHSIRERAALLGGTVRVESQVGAGTLIVVDLPLHV